jgi:hypothetical protein
MRKQLLAIVPFVLGVGGCNIYACKYETRFIATQGSASSPTVGSVIAQSMNFRQYKPEQPVSNSVSYVVHGEGLLAAPTRITLRDNRDPSRAVFDLSAQTSSTSFAAASGYEVASADRNGMFELLASGNARVVLEISNGGTLSVPLVTSSREDWHRPSCD